MGGHLDFARHLHLDLLVLHHLLRDLERGFRVRVEGQGRGSRVRVEVRGRGSGSRVEGQGRG